MNQINFAMNLYALRKRQNFSQKDLARKCGVSWQSVAKWENGHSTPDLYILSTAAQILEVTVDDLIYGDLGEMAEESGIELEPIIHLAIKTDDILDFIEKQETHTDIYDVYNRYCENQMDWELAEAAYQEGCEAGKKGHLEEAFSSLEQSLVYGKTEVATTLIKAYMNILDMLAIDEKEGEYNRYEMLFGKKIQQYGRILVSERKRKNELETLDFDSSARNKS